MEQENKETLKAAAGLWQVHLKKLHYDIPVQKSPERQSFALFWKMKKGTSLFWNKFRPNPLNAKERLLQSLIFIEEKTDMHQADCYTDPEYSRVPFRVWDDYIES